jgi:hypothetical protein
MSRPRSDLTALYRTPFTAARAGSGGGGPASRFPGCKAPIRELKISVGGKGEVEGNGSYGSIGCSAYWSRLSCDGQFVEIAGFECCTAVGVSKSAGFGTGPGGTSDVALVTEVTISSKDDARIDDSDILWVEKGFTAQLGSNEIGFSGAVGMKDGEVVAEKGGARAGSELTETTGIPFRAPV